MVRGPIPLQQHALGVGGRVPLQPESVCEKQQVRLWETVFDKGIYSSIRENAKLEAVGRDFVGWISHYNGQPLDKAEMNEWLDESIAAILDSDGGHTMNLLELGTGSGMILFNLAKNINSYVGLDPSKKAVDFVLAMAKSNPELKDKTKVIRGTATDIHLAEGSESTDVVVINSVAQYFPSQGYLTKVVQGILQLENVRTIFFGDIRSHALEPEFMVSKTLDKLGETATKQDVQAELGKPQSELLIDPAFFTGLLDLFPNRIEHVEIRPKMMKATNELSQYRYAASIYVKNAKNPREQPENAHRYEIRHVESDAWVNFVEQTLDGESLLRHLSTTDARVVAVKNITYSKTVLERHIIDSLKSDSPQNGWLSSARQQSAACSSLSPMDLKSIAKEAGYEISISWARQRSQRGALDAVFYRDRKPDGGRVLFRFPGDHEEGTSQLLCNQPLP